MRKVKQPYGGLVGRLFSFASGIASHRLLEVATRSRVPVACALLVLCPLVQAAVGRTEGVASVSANGAAEYSIPLATPPGTNGLQPELSLNYSSSSGTGHFGVGWSLTGLSAIARCPRTWTQDGVAREVRNDASDRFCLDGNQLRGVGPNEYRTEIETFARVRAFGTAGNGPAYFIVERKDGLIYEYGNTADSQINSVGQATARLWAVNRVRDRSGNAMLFTYTEDSSNGSFRIANIQYTQNSNQGISPRYQVSFVYEPVPVGEVDAAFQAGGLIKRVMRADRIDVTHDGALVRRYELTYEPGLSSTSKSRLASLQECAGPTPECFPATTFSYQNGTAGLNAEVATGLALNVALPLDVNGDGREDLVYATGGAWKVALAVAAGGYGGEINTGIPSNNAGAAISIDYNADGLADVMVPHSGSTWWVLLGTTGGLAAPFDTGIPITATGTGVNARAIDVDGDGLQDLVWADLFGFAGGDAIRYRLRVLGGTFSSTVETLVGPFPAEQLIFAPFGPSIPFSGSNIPDFNGDGRGDVAYQHTRRIFIDGPNTFNFNHTVRAVCPGGTSFAAVLQQSTTPHFGDFNGDGRSDLLYLKGGGAATMQVRFSTGSAFTGEIQVLSGSAFNGPYLVLDWDVDGFDDVLLGSSTGWAIARSTGEGFSATASTGIPMTPNGISVTDLNGDGLADLGYSVGGVWRYRTHAGVQPDLLLNATDGYGVSASFQHAPLTSAAYSKSIGAVFPEQDYQGALNVVTSATQSNGIGGTFTTSHAYYGARMHLQGRGFVGFERQQTRDSRNGLYLNEYFNLGFPYVGSVQRVEVLQPNGATLISRNQNTWVAHTYGSGFETRSLPYVSSVTGQQYEVGGPFNGVLIRSTATTTVVDVNTGTLTDSTTTVTEGSNANGLNPGQSYSLRTYSPMLFTDSAQWCIGRPESVQQINSHALYGGASQTRIANTTWDGFYCRPTQSVIEPGNPTRQVTTDLGYDGFGNLATQSVTPIGESARLTQLNWGADGRFPSTLTNPLSQVSTLDWWPELGQLRSTSDPNGLVSSSFYDAFGRLVTEVRPDNTSTLIEYLPCDSDCVGFPNSKYKIRSTLRDSGAGTIAQSFSLIDAFDRPRRSSSYALEGGLINQLTEYDALGRVSRTSTPYFSFAANPVWTTLTYDVVGRQRQATRDRTSDADASAASSTTQFDGLSITSTDLLGKVRVDTLDPLGQIVRAVQASGTVDQATTSYNYDAFGNLVRTTDGVGNQINVGYDVRGFKISSADPDLGNWTYDYYALGELKSQTDAKSQLTSFTYDKLSRPLTREEPADSGSGMQTTTWMWGASAASFNIGQLQSIAVGSYSESYAYDSRSRLSSTTVVADGGSYVLGQSYNVTTGLLETITYPASTSASPFKLKYEYETANKSGLLQRVKDFNAGTVFWQAISSNAQGQFQDVTLGNGLKTLTAFDSITGVTNRIETGPAGGTTLQYLQYAWDKVGNVTSRQDLNISKLETFSYDNLYRMTQAQVSGATALTVAYDQIGNITSKSDLGAYVYHPIKKHAVATAGPITSTYDANGNVETQMAPSGTATVGWTAYNLPKLVSTSSGRSSQFLYGADRQRYKQVALASGVTETTIYVKGIFEKVTRPFGTEYRHLIQGPDGVIAIHNRKSSGTNETRYLLKDHLGSTDVITNDAGASTVKLSFTAFGARRKGSTWSGSPTSLDQIAIASTSRLAFTGHEQLDHLDLVHMNGRVYQPLTGRFISADPFVQAPFNSQSLNRYSYVFNNPLSFTDPSGFAGSADDFGRKLPINGRSDVPRAGLTLSVNLGVARVQSRPVPRNYVPRRLRDAPGLLSSNRTQLSGATTIPAAIPCDLVACDRVAGPVSAVGKIGGFLFPNITAFRERGVTGSGLDFAAGFGKATLNLSSSVSSLINPTGALILGTPQFELSDTQLGGAAAFEAVSLVVPVGRAGAAEAGAARASELLLDTNVVIGQGRQFLASGLSVVKAAITDTELAYLVRQGRIFPPRAAAEIPSVSNSLNVDLRINVRALLKKDKAGNFADGVIGATAIERGSTLVTSDKALREAVNAMGGTAIKP